MNVWLARYGALSLAAICSLLGSGAVLQGHDDENRSTGSQADGGDGDEIVALVGKRPISRYDLERQWQTLDPAGFARVQQQVHEGEDRALDSLIDDYVLQDEADRQHVTIEELLGRAPGEAPKEAEIQEMFDRSSAAAQGIAFDVASPLIQKYLKQQKDADARRRYVELLKRTASVDVRRARESWRQVVTIDVADPRSGPAAAPVTLVEFSDFQCPYCKRAAPVLKQVLDKYQGQVTLVWKDFPLPMHRSAAAAAEAAHCAREQGRFWEFHDVLFRNQDALASEDLQKHARELGLNNRTFNECLQTGRVRSIIAAGIREGTKLGVSATPTVFINGRPITGAVPLEAYEHLIREELASARPLRSTP